MPVGYIRSVTTVILLILYIHKPLAAANGEIPEFREALQQACPDTDTEKYYSTLLPIVRGIKNPAGWQQTTKAVMGTACSLAMPDWRVRVVFSLGHYGLENGLQPGTVTRLTELLGNDSIGKEEFLKTGRLWEKMGTTGMNQADQAELISFGRQKNLRSVQMEGLALVYVHFRKEGLNHKEALEKAADLLPLLQKAHRAEQVNKIVRDKIYPAEKPDAIKNKSDGEQELWLQYKDSLSSLSPDYRGVRATIVLAPQPRENTWDVERLNLFIEEWLATPYRYGGFSRAGIDCSGFVIKAASDQFPEVQLPRSAYDMASLGNPVARTALQTGDLVFFATSKVRGRISHVGIYLKDGQFVHASTKRGITISHLSEKYYAKRYIAARRIF